MVVRCAAGSDSSGASDDKDVTAGSPTASKGITIFISIWHVHIRTYSIWHVHMLYGTYIFYMVRAYSIWYVHMLYGTYIFYMVHAIVCMA